MRIPLRTLSLVMVAAFVLLPPAAAATPESETLSRTINRELRAGGPWFTAGERALVERKCGYAPGQWDGFEVNISNNVLTCTNGRRVDDPEIRAMLRTAGPRISARVREVMARPAVSAAIHLVARNAAARAMRRIGARHAD
ncbi:MAG TPA: hypothetical protein VEC11_01700 [Allosphingosinicella sp.]|nr:hypothetical protein [Allosphingosinicella sp.]